MSKPSTAPLSERAADTADTADTGAVVLVRRLRRVAGQVEGLVRMVEAGRDCADVVTQLTAASHALDPVGFLLVAGELRRCAASASAAEVEERLAAVEQLFVRLG